MLLNLIMLILLVLELRLRLVACLTLVGCRLRSRSTAACWRRVLVRIVRRRRRGRLGRGSRRDEGMR